MTSRNQLPARSVDAVIVGAGQVGSLLAARLAAAGKRVVVFEAGPERRAGGLVSSQIWARQLKGTPGCAESVGSHALGVNFNTGQGGGGSALHHYACWFRLHPEDFAMRSRHGVAADWPLDYEALRPAYDRVQSDVGISGDAAAEVWRPAGAPYPMPPLPVFRQGELIAAGFAAKGLRVAPLPLAINSIPYKGRPACIYDGWCDAGCPTGALANPLVTYLREARTLGARIEFEARVVRVRTNADGTRATGVDVALRDGRVVFQEAALVIIAGFAVETPRLLLASANGAHGRGLANSSGQLGKRLHTHAACTIFGRFPEPTDNHLGVNGGQLVCQDRYGKDQGHGFLGGYQWLIGHALRPNDLLGIAGGRPDLHGAALTRFMRDDAAHVGSMTMVGESFPLEENAVSLSETTDRFGVPLARLTHRFDENAVKLHAHASAEGQDLLRAGGASATWQGPLVGMHLLGGARMGKDPAHAVADEFGITHDVRNLMIAGPSLFPSGGAVNPTFTASALAHRAAEHVVGRWSDLFG
ncbi:oxidoreductase [Denitratisoma sp. DHT3]|uniref:GMC oxidoreductase n=1 Tax=Denitratisoma sp. DHT3 TaxID=1981880 RepID=UPI0011986BBC|nr:GMC family oxidoreductase [Denitratisoma sp. DHT3]QDX80601.1 oxidoreductase [Denitratisoma sp. DHT3]